MLIYMSPYVSSSRLISSPWPTTTNSNKSIRNQLLLGSSLLKLHVWKESSLSSVRLTVHCDCWMDTSRNTSLRSTGHCSVAFYTKKTI